MASPLAPFANARLLLETPGARGGPETGYKRVAGESIVLTLFLKQVSEKERAIFKQIETQSVASDFLEGYIVSHAVLPDGADWQTYDLATGLQDTTGTRPAALYKGARAAAIQFGSRTSQAVEVVEAAGTFDDQGIGAIVRGVLGDRLLLTVEWRQ